MRGIIVAFRQEEQPQDKEESTYDKYRSENAVPVGPQGGYLQSKMSTPSGSDMDEMRVRDACQFGGNFGRSLRFDLEEQPGGCTFIRGQVLCERD